MKKLQIVIGLLVSAGLIYVVLRNIDFKEVGDILSDIRYSVILPAIVVQLASYWVRSVRWSYMLRSIKKVKSARLFPVICISYLANNVLPLRIGEVVRAYLVGKKEDISKPAAFSTVILERIYDGLTLILFLVLTSVAFPFPDWVKSIGIITAVAFLSALLFIIGLVVFQNTTTRIFKKVAGLFGAKLANKADSILGQFLEGLNVVKDKRSLLPIALYSILIWAMEGYLFYAIAEAFDFSSTVYVALFVLVVVNLGIMIPSSPGYVGTFEYFCTKALSIFKIPSELAVGYALVLRIFQYLPITLLGFIFLLREGISFSQMLNPSEKSKTNIKESAT